MVNSHVTRVFPFPFALSLRRNPIISYFLWYTGTYSQDLRGESTCIWKTVLVRGENMCWNVSKENSRSVINGYFIFLYRLFSHPWFTILLRFKKLLQIFPLLYPLLRSKRLRLLMHGRLNAREEVGFTLPLESFYFFVYTR